MSAPLRLRAETEGPRLDARPAPDPIAGWLDVLTRMLPARQAAEVREELEEHVRDRVRDLVLAGQDDTAATRTAIAELGDAAAVAQRFRDAARTPKRRLAMNLAVLGVAGAALMTSLVGVMRPGTGTGGQVYQPIVAERVPSGKEPGLPALDFNDLGLEEALSAVAKSAGAGLLVRWSSVGGGGLEPETRVTWNGPAGSLSGVFDALNDVLARDLGGERLIDFRLRDGVLEVARPEWFDQRESTLVRYDLRPLHEQDVPLDEFMSLVEQFVSSDDWENNGGTLAKYRVVGLFAFVKGPPRVHDGVSWFLAQFTEDGGDPGAAADQDGGPVRVYHIQHTDAQDLLKVLMNMQSIREVDFTPWAADARTNSILGKAPAKHHDMVARAIRDLDNPGAALKRQIGQKQAEMQAVTAALLAQAQDDRARIEAELAQLAQRGVAEDDADAQVLRDRLKQAQQREDEARARLLMLQQAPEASDRRGAAEAPPEPTETADTLARERALTDFIAGTLTRPIEDGPMVGQVLRNAMVTVDLEPTVRSYIALEPALRLALAFEPEPITRALLMAHADATTVAEALRSVLKGTGESPVTIEVDKAHNTVILRGPKEPVLAAEEGAWKLDQLAGVVPRRE